MTSFLRIFTQNFDNEDSNTKPNQFSRTFSDKEHSVWYS